jgi:ABC-type sugar transport system permease subunit
MASDVTVAAEGAAAGRQAGRVTNPLDRRHAWLGVMLIAPTVLIFCAVVVYPLVSALYLSLFRIFTPTLSGSFVGFANYAELAARRSSGGASGTTWSGPSSRSCFRWSSASRRR